MENAKKVLKNVINAPRSHLVSTKEVINAVIQFYNLDVRDLLGQSRKKEIAFPRQILMYLLREEARASYPAIGNELGGRDHTTVIHAYKKINEEVNNNEDLHQEIELIKQRIYSE
jgi:chromosomal replication initiator protein